MYRKYKNAELVKPSGLDLKDHLIGVQRVTKVTKGGRAFGFSAIVVVGDEAGVVGQGLGKSKDVATAIAKGIEDAKKKPVFCLNCQSIMQQTFDWTGMEGDVEKKATIADGSDKCSVCGKYAKSGYNIFTGSQGATCG